MNDKMENFFRDNRQDFDTETPDQAVWSHIEKQLPGRNLGYPVQMLWKAAAVIFFLSTVGLTAYTVNRGTPVQKVAESGDFKQVEDFYFHEINQKKALITDFQAKKDQNNHSAELELQRLDAMYLVLKEEMRKNPSKEVIDALTLNLLVRVDLLNKVLADVDPNTGKGSDAVEI